MSYIKNTRHDFGPRENVNIRVINRYADKNGVNL